jgi:cob(I)alamin adenosyltransferase
MKGYVQVYTGDGKGKTTAALGLALRAVGAGLKVYIAQFVKGMAYSEHKSLLRFSPAIVVKQYGRGCFVDRTPAEEDVQAAQEGLKEAKAIMRSEEYQMIILDEANIATCLGLFSVEALLDCVRERPQGVELVITGRGADPRIIEEADLVTEMREIKHYYRTGTKAREGIEK